MADTLNRRALLAMIHHVTRTYGMEPEKLGAVKLHKIIWNTEVQHVRRTGYPITGETFIKRAQGPWSANLDSVVAELRTRRLLHVSPPDDEYKPILFVGKGTPDRDALTDEQWTLLDRIAERIVEDHTAGSISERSHGPVWEATEMYEPMSVDAEAITFVKPKTEIRQEIAAHAATLE